MRQNIQIIGGRFRGKKLSFPNVEGLRPTPDRVRETLFNWLMRDIQGARCLDLFAGSGALGLEAYSRGAAQVTLLERSNTVFNHLQKTISSFSSADIKLIHMEALQFLDQSREQFDIIFLDPPFGSTLVEQCIEQLTNASILASQGLIYIESATPIGLDNQKWREVHMKRAGQVYYGLYEKL